MGRKRKNYDYEKKIQLNHNEIPAKINLETGEVIEVKSRNIKIEPGKQKWLPKQRFTKYFDYGGEVIDWLEDTGILTDLEARVLGRLMRRAKYGTNSLEPLNDHYAIKLIAEDFNISRNKVAPLLRKFYNLGIYGNFDVKRLDYPYTKFWILNPYLSIKGDKMDSDISKLFEGTVIHLKFMEFLERDAQ